MACALSSLTKRPMMTIRSRSAARHTGPLCLALACSIALPNVARADEPDPIAAEALLSQGFALAEAGNLEAACGMMEASLRLYPSVNTEYYLADCYERIGKAASAWIDFQEVADRARVN